MNNIFDFFRDEIKKLIFLIKQMQELPIVKRTYELIKWYVPFLNRLAKVDKFTLADRMISRLYSLLENLIIIRYDKEKLLKLGSVNTQLDILRYQTQLLYDFQLLALHRYKYAIRLINQIGIELSDWIEQPSNY